jgi:hypothetical protein
MLAKKIVIYRMMGNSFFLDHANSMVNASYKVFGKKVTNGVINVTAG